MVDDLTAYLGFFGAWLVVAGSVYQAMLELLAEDEAVEKIRSMMVDQPRPDPVSPWWWLLPPVHVVLTKRRRERSRDELIGTMTAEEYDVLARYINKATGWLFVGFGGALIATNETRALVRQEGWPTAVFVALEVVMVAVAIGHSIARTDRTRRHAAAHHGTPLPERRHR